MRAQWNYPTHVRFGAGRVVELPALCAELGIHRPMVVTDTTLCDTPVFTQAVIEFFATPNSPLGLFSNVSGNPTGAAVKEGVARFGFGRHDGIVALGGGSAIDAGKAIALMVGQSRPLWDFEDVGDNHRRVDVAGMVSTIAVPTTAGTGAEVGRASVITHEAERRKVIIFHPKMMPAAAVLDPELTVSLPPGLTAATGMDALSHCLEAFFAPGYHPQADGIAVEGVRLVHRALLRAYRDGNDIDARGDMLTASMMGATAFQKGLGAMHALSHPLGARRDTHHGLTNAVVMPYVLVKNRPVIEARAEDLTRALGLMSPGFDALLGFVLDLRSALSIPHNLAEIGMQAGDVDELAAMAEVDPAGAGNPLPIDRGDYANLYRAAFEGTLT